MTGRAGRTLTAVPLAVAVLALAGCGPVGSSAESAGAAASAGPPRSAGARPSATGSGSSATGGAPSVSPSATAAPSGEESLPPGDPGLDAPTAADPGTTGVEPDQGRARRQVPAAALLDPVDAGQMLGGRWTTAQPDVDACVVPASWVGRRTVGLASAGATVAETVSTHPGAAAADAAVAALRTRLPDCGWDLGADPRLGTASLTATRGATRLGVVAAEGVTVVLVGRGSSVTGYGWSGLLDMALGSSCAAADGCH